MTEILRNILKLSVPERILLAETIWDSISEKEVQVELSEETKQLLDERIENHKSNPIEGSPWNEVKDRIRKQF